MSEGFVELAIAHECEAGFLHCIKPIASVEQREFVIVLVRDTAVGVASIASAARPARVSHVCECPRRAPAARRASSVGKTQRRDEWGGRNARMVASSQSPVPEPATTFLAVHVPVS